MKGWVNRIRWTTGGELCKDNCLASRVSVSGFLLCPFNTYSKKIKKEKDGLTVFADRIRRRTVKINCLASAMRRQFPIFTVLCRPYILIMSIHIAAKQGEIADKIFLGLSSCEIYCPSLKMLFASTKSVTCFWLQGLTRSPCVSVKGTGMDIDLYLCAWVDRRLRCEEIWSGAGNGWSFEWWCSRPWIGLCPLTNSNIIRNDYHDFTNRFWSF